MIDKRYINIYWLKNPNFRPDIKYGEPAWVTTVSSDVQEAEMDWDYIKAKELELNALMKSNL